MIVKNDNLMMSKEGQCFACPRKDLRLQFHNS